jgi:hypothetical protein
MFSSAVSKNPGLLEKKKSCLEKHNFALFVHPSIFGKSEDVPTPARYTKGELGHVHGETSLHLYLSPADAKVVIEKGWAERHRLARAQPWYFGKMKYMWGIGDSFLIIYAPRDQEELDILKRLIRASAEYMTGRDDIKEP